MELRRLKQRSNHEEAMIKRRDKEMRHAETWGNTVKYYDRMGTHTSKFDNWTSPRYYEDNNKLIKSERQKRDHEELLEKRKVRLRQLFADDKQTYDIELMMIKAGTPRAGVSRDATDDILQDINNKMKLNDEARRRQRAEEGLYRQWRGNPVLRDCESRKNTRDLKMSWLDSQIEKRMAKEKEEEMMRKVVKETECHIQEMREKEQQLAECTEAEKRKLAQALQEQIEEIKEREQVASQLRADEDQARKLSAEAADLREQWAKEEKQRGEKEIALFNLRQHRRRLDEKSKQVKEELRKDLDFLEKINRTELLEKIEDQNKKRELRVTMDRFNALLCDLRELEEKRRPHVEFTFESEAKSVFDQFNASWSKEKKMRETLMKEVLREIHEQIRGNAERNKAKQLELIEEKEQLLGRAETYRAEMDGLKDEEVRKREAYKAELDEQVKENRQRKKKLETLERKTADEELEALQKEELRIKKEITKIRAGNYTSNYGRKKTFY